MNFGRSSRAWGVAMALCALLVVSASQKASAMIGSATYPITASNGFDGPGPFGSVTIDVTSTTAATISFSATPPFQFFGLAFNFDGTAAGGPTGTISTITPPDSWTIFSNTSMDGFGSFTDHVRGTGAAQALSTGSIGITGTNLELAQFQVLSSVTPGQTAAVVAVEVVNTTTGVTGFAAGGAVPEPSSLAIAGLGGLGFIGYGLRRRLKK